MTSSLNWRLNRFVVSGLALSIAAMSQAQLSPIERDGYYALDFSDLTFSDATVNENLYQEWSGTQGSYYTQTFSTPTGFTFLGWTGDSNMGVSDLSTTDSSVTGTVTSLTGDNGWTDLDAEFGLGNSFLNDTVVNGLHALEITSGSFGGVDAGDPFSWNLIINGDWSSQGTGTGQSELLGYDSADGWQIGQDFVYDPTLNVTYFSLYQTAYNNTGVGLSIQLNGSTATPSPAAILPFASGLLGAVARRRRR